MVVHTRTETLCVSENRTIYVLLNFVCGVSFSCLLILYERKWISSMLKYEVNHLRDNTLCIRPTNQRSRVASKQWTHFIGMYLNL